MPRSSSRPFDVVVLGATGFTGLRIARYLHTAKPHLRVALAGRSKVKLAAVNQDIGASFPVIGVCFERERASGALSVRPPSVVGGWSYGFAPG
jgi:short subunit dehydrogenase-like uncharacterized protein